MRFVLILLLIMTAGCSGPASRSFLNEQGHSPDLDDVPSEGEHCLGNKCLFYFENNDTLQTEWYMIHKDGELRETFRIDCGSKEGVQNRLGIFAEPLMLGQDLKESFDQHYKPKESPTLPCVTEPIQKPNNFFEEAFRLGSKIYYYYTLPNDAGFKAYVFDSNACQKDLDLFNKVSGGIPITTVTGVDSLIETAKTLNFDCSRNSKPVVSSQTGWTAYKAKGNASYFMLVRYRWPNGETGDFVIGKMKSGDAFRTLDSLDDLNVIEAWLTANFANITFEMAMPTPFEEGLGAELWETFDTKPVLAFDPSTTQFAAEASAPAVAGKTKRLIFRSGTTLTVNHLEAVNTTTVTYPALNFKKGLGRLVFGDGSAAFASIQTLEGDQPKSYLHLLERCDGEYWKGYLDYLGLSSDLQEKERSWSSANYYERALYDYVEHFSSKVAVKSPGFRINRLPCVRKVEKICKLKIETDEQLRSFLRGEAAAFASCNNLASLTDLHVHLEKPSDQLAQDFRLNGTFSVGGIEKPNFKNALPALKNLTIEGNANQPTTIKLDCGTQCYDNRSQCPLIDKVTHVYPMLAFENIPSVTLKDLTFMPEKTEDSVNDPLVNRQAGVSFVAIGKALLQNVQVTTFEVSKTKSVGFGTGLCAANTNLLMQGSGVKATTIGVLAQNGMQVMTPRLVSFANYDGKVNNSTPQFSITADISTLGRAIEISQESRLILNDAKLTAARGIFLEGIIADNDLSKSGPSFIANQTEFVFPTALALTARKKAVVDIHWVAKKPSYVIKSKLGKFEYMGTAITGAQALEKVTDYKTVNNVVFEALVSTESTTQKTDARFTDVFNLCSVFDEPNNSCLSLY